MQFPAARKLFLLCSIIFFTNCETEDAPDAPQLPEIVTVTEETEAVVTHTSVEITGSFAAEEDEVTSYGVVWASEPNPTIEDNVVIPDEIKANNWGKETLKQAVNSFTVRITDLIPGETYYFRTFATNEAGTAYGEEINVQTAGLAGTTWKATYRHTEENSWIAHVEFHEDGTAFYTEPAAPGIYDSWGEWSMEGNILTYDMFPEDEGESYVLTGEVIENEMSGTYTFQTNDGMTHRPWDAVLLSTAGE